jgi:hypothetical protein
MTTTKTTTTKVKVRVRKQKPTHHFCYSYTQQQILTHLDGMRITYAMIDGKLKLYTECNDIQFGIDNNYDFKVEHRRRFHDSIYLGVGRIYMVNNVKQKLG